MVIRIIPTQYINAQINYLFHWVTLLTHTKLGHDCHRQSPTVFSCSRDESGDVITFTTQLNKTADCAKYVQNSPTVSGFIELGL